MLFEAVGLSLTRLATEIRRQTALIWAMQVKRDLAAACRRLVCSFYNVQTRLDLRRLKDRFILAGHGHSTHSILWPYLERM